MKEGTFVMLLLFLCALNINCKTPKKSSSITDKEGILTVSQRNQFDSLFDAHEKKTSNEIGLVTTPDYGRDTSILAFAVRFGNEQEIGKKNRNNGVIVAFSRTQKETNISTGYGTEKVLKDEIAKQIIDSIMIPRFKEGKEFEGLWNGCKAIVAFLEKAEDTIH